MCVGFLDAVQFANALSARDGLRRAYTVQGDVVDWDRTANGYRLPTEAEWEYAARAGTTTPHGTDKPKDAEVCRAANVLWCSDGVAGPAAVGSYRANGWGLHDMVGNVEGRVWDWHGLYPTTAVDPTGPESNPYSNRVYRGGSWIDSSVMDRIASRGWAHSSSRINDVGFRLARSIP